MRKVRIQTEIQQHELVKHKKMFGRIVDKVYYEFSVTATC